MNAATGHGHAGPACLGLTGGIGSGKSAALDAFRRRGAATQSSDDVVHALYARPDVITAVTERFGADVLRPDGTVDRSVLGGKAFGQPGGIPFLERLLHPRVAVGREEWVQAQRAAVSPPPLVVCEVPLLFELSLQDRFDAVLVVTAPEEVRRERVRARGQVFGQRADLQWPEERKVAAADHVYVNDGDLAALDGWAGEIFERYAR